MESHNTQLRHSVRPDDILVAGYSFGSSSSWEQPSTSILANQIPLVVALVAFSATIISTVLFLQLNSRN